MTCILLSHLQEKLRLAEIRHESAEVEWLKKEIAEHVRTCPICSNPSIESLLQEFFRRPVVIVGEVQS